MEITEVVGYEKGTIVLNPLYQFVEDEQELEAVFEIFTQLLDDADVELQK